MRFVRGVLSDLVSLWILNLVAVTTSVTGLTCNIGATIPLQPGVGDDGNILSHNYPREYPAVRGFCEVVFEVCDLCHIELNFNELQLAPCSQPNLFSSDSETCDQADLCEYIILVEAGKSPKKIGGAGQLKHYKSSSPSLKIRFCYSASITDKLHAPLRRWRINFLVTDTFTFRVDGAPWDAETRQGVISLPGFPDGYACQGENVTFLLNCKQDGGFVKLQFDDFDINTISSKLIIFDGNSRSAPLQVYASRYSRPSLLSAGPYALLEFVPGNETCSAGDRETHSAGFKIHYQFFPKNAKRTTDLQTDCQEHYDRLSGREVVTGWLVSRHVDCIWIYKPWSTLWLTMQFININLKLDGKNTLEIRRSYHSQGPLIAILRNKADISKIPMEGITTNSGFYIRLKGQMSHDELLEFAYTNFLPVPATAQLKSGCVVQISDNYSLDGFLCLHSSRCIPSKLVCDGISHCTASEDEEPIMCSAHVQTSAPGHYEDCQMPKIRCAVDGSCVHHVELCPLSLGTDIKGKLWQGTCLIKELQCSDGSGCFSLEERCDGHPHCMDHSDELYGCDPLRIVVPSLLASVILITCLIATICLWKRHRRKQNDQYSRKRSSRDDEEDDDDEEEMQVAMHTFQTASLHRSSTVQTTALSDSASAEIELEEDGAAEQLYTPVESAAQIETMDECDHIIVGMATNFSEQKDLDDHEDEIKPLMS